MGNAVWLEDIVLIRGQHEVRRDVIKTQVMGGLVRQAKRLT